MGMPKITAADLIALRDGGEFAAHEVGELAPDRCRDGGG